MAEEDRSRVSDNPLGSRYELRLADAVVGFLVYEVQADTAVLLHAEVEAAYEGRGLGSRLVAGALDDLRARGLSVVPVCPFVTSYLRRHPEYADLVARERVLGAGA